MERKVILLLWRVLLDSLMYGEYMSAQSILEGLSGLWKESEGSEW